MAIHCLWWPTLINWVVLDLAICSKTCGSGEHPDKWSNVEEFNDLRFLYELIIVALLAHLRDVVPHGLLPNYAFLRRLASGNKGATVIFVFLYEYDSQLGLDEPPILTICGEAPFLCSSLQGRPSIIRCKSIIRMFRSRCTHLSERSIPSTERALFVEIPAATLLRTSPWNNSTKTSRPVSPIGTAKRSDIDPFITVLNGVRDVENKVRVALGVPHFDLDETSAIEKEDVAFLVAELKKKIPSETFFSDNPTNPFGSGTPWVDTHNQRPRLESYIKRHLSKTDCSMPSEADW